MHLNELTAISPIDGRYRSKTNELAAYFSEFGLIRDRVLVEIEYFIALAEAGIKPMDSFPKEKCTELKNIYLNFSEEDALWIKNTEKTTNHDVKAVEYFIKEKLSEMELGQFTEFIHFGLTSQDVNNTSIPLSLKQALFAEFFPVVNELIIKLNDLKRQWKDIAMLAKTHGQPASPTRVAMPPIRSSTSGSPSPPRSGSVPGCGGERR